MNLKGFKLKKLPFALLGFMAAQPISHAAELYACHPNSGQSGWSCQTTQEPTMTQTVQPVPLEQPTQAVPPQATSTIVKQPSKKTNIDSGRPPAPIAPQPQNKTIVAKKEDEAKKETPQPVVIATEEKANSIKNTKDVTRLIGWVPSSMQENYCSGYYLESALPPVDPNVPLNQAPATIAADQSSYSSQGTSELAGNVVITQPGRQLESRHAYLHRDPQTGKINQVDLYGHVVIRKPGMLIVGDEAHGDLFDKSGTIKQGVYRSVAQTNTDANATNDVGEIIDVPNKGKMLKINEQTAWGRASKIDQERPGLYKFYKASYTVCAPTDPSWKLNANTITLNKDTGRGEATNVVLRVKDIPVFYTPYFNFPIDDRRKSGILMPTFNTSSTDGVSVALPFYWNMAPNYDMTITPTVITERGLNVKTLFRYMTSNDDKGKVTLGFIPGDREFESFKNDIKTGKDYANAPQGLKSRVANDSDNRYFFAWEDTRAFGNHWTTGLNYNKVSDDYYFHDFGGGSVVQTDNQLLQEASVNYAGNNWDFMTRVQGYQTLHPINQTVVENQYRRLPQILINGDFPDKAYGLDYKMNLEMVNFEKQQNPGANDDPSTNFKPTTGQRINFEPGVSLPFVFGTSGYIKPQLQLDITDYYLTDPALKNSTTGQHYSKDPSRVLPIFDVDAGLYFDRNTSLFGDDYTQTLEPRIFYLYVPYENQNDIPVFDTSLPTFSASQLYRTNRFSGNDRLGDANQVSLGLTSRFLDSETANERFKTTVGEIVYFRDRKVKLCQDTNSIECQNELTDGTSDTSTVSPFVGSFDYHLSQNWNINGDLAWEVANNRANSGDTYFQYKSDDQHIINLGYNFLRNGDTLNFVDSDSDQNNLEQVNVSAMWPLVKQWSALGRWNYNVSHDHIQNTFLGVQYDSCCWAFRAIAERHFDYFNDHNQPQFENGFYLQFQLKSLANVGTNDPSGLIGDGINGFVDSFKATSW